MKFVEFPHEDTFDYQAERLCKNCDHSFAGRYCNRCGEKVIVAEDRSLIRFFRKIFNSVPIFDNKFMRTMRLMVLRPGFVSSSYIQGRRIPFVDPLHVFLIINLFYFLFPAIETFNSPLRTHMHFLLHSETATVMVEDRLRKEGIDLHQFEVRYDQHATNAAKIMLVSFVLILAVPFWIMNYSTGLYFRDHLIVSLEFCSISLLLNNLALPWTWIFIQSLFAGSTGSQGLSSPVMVAVIIGAVSLFLFYRMERITYNCSRRKSLFLATLMICGLFLSLHFYYGVVFFITMWTL